MKDFLRRNGIWLLVIALLLSILIGVSSAFMGGNADPLSNLVTTITTPVRNGAAAVGDFFQKPNRTAARQMQEASRAMEKLTRRR